MSKVSLKVCGLKWGGLVVSLHPPPPGKPCSEVGTADQKRLLWAPTVPHGEAEDQPPSHRRCRVRRTFQLFRPPNLGQPLTALRLLPGPPPAPVWPGGLKRAEG